MRSLLRINPYQQHFLSMKFLPLGLLLALIVFVPVPAQAETYIRTFPASDLGKFNLEGEGWFKQTDGKECYSIGSRTYDTEAACKANIPAYTEQIKALRDGKITDSCIKLTRSTYSYTRTGPVCPSVIAALGLKTSDGTGGTANKTNDGKGGTATKSGAEGGGAQTLKNPLKFNSLPELLNAVLDAVIELGAILLVFMLVWVGFLFVTAQGNPEKVSTARSALLWTLIGGLILLGAKAISLVVQSTVTSITP
jgi:hypothetical protein